MGNILEIVRAHGLFNRLESDWTTTSETKEHENSQLLIAKLIGLKDSR